MHHGSSFFRTRILPFIMGMVFITFPLWAQKGTGAIVGTVIDQETQAPLVGVNVLVQGTVLGAASDLGGRFLIDRLPAGSYTLVFRYIGYEPRTHTDVIVRPGRTSQVQAALRMAAVAGETVTITAGYFEKRDDAPTSAVGFTNEEIRRAPGSAGDVSRILMGLPSVAKVNDQQNGLIVRGGSPMENGFYIDEIEIPNINHFPMQGASSGPIGMVNVDFIKDVTFQAGGFPATYGNRLSSVMAMGFREGDREHAKAQLDLNMTGFGGVVEGPLPGKKGSWMMSLRRSYLDLVIDMVDMGTSMAPRYGDFQGKVVWDVAPAHRLYLLWLWGDDRARSDKEIAVENDMVYFGNQDLLQGTTGLGWRALWGDKGYSTTTLSFVTNEFDEIFYDTGSSGLLYENHSQERQINLRHLSHFRLHQAISLDFGLDGRRLFNRYDNRFAASWDAVGGVTEAIQFKKNLNGTRLGGHVSLSFRPNPRLSFTLGGRGDWSEITGQATFAPRGALSFKLTDRTSLSASGGAYHQSLPSVLLAQQPANMDLPQPRAWHGVIGLEHMLTESTRLTLEGYVKRYDRFPMDAAQPDLFLIDEIVYQYWFFGSHGPLQSVGKARSHGVEMVLQKKLAERLYGMVSASWFRSEYEDGEGRWRERVFDNRVVFNVEGGYKPNNRWEFSLRWTGAGGAPYTPLDLDACAAQNRTVLSASEINAARYPVYHSLNLRVDRRFHFGASSLVAYVSVWNAYARKNIAQYFWNTEEQKQDAITQWTRLPIVGLEYEF